MKINIKSSSCIQEKLLTTKQRYYLSVEEQKKNFKNIKTKNKHFDIQSDRLQINCNHIKGKKRWLLKF